MFNKTCLWDFNTLDKWSSIHTHYGVNFYKTDILCNARIESS